VCVCVCVCWCLMLFHGNLASDFPGNSSSDKWIKLNDNSQLEIQSQLIRLGCCGRAPLDGSTAASSGVKEQTIFVPIQWKASVEIGHRSAPLIELIQRLAIGCSPAFLFCFLLLLLLLLLMLSLSSVIGWFIQHRCRTIGVDFNLIARMFRFNISFDLILAEFIGRRIWCFNTSWPGTLTQWSVSLNSFH